jgi:hypothetical protein
VPAPEFVQGEPLPTAPGSGRERVITEWDSQFKQVGMHLRTIARDGWVCTVYEKSTDNIGYDLGLVPRMLAGGDFPQPDIRYDGTEGELYNLHDDPMQWQNLWNDPARQKIKSELIADMYDNLPKPRDPLFTVEAPA